MEFLGPKSCFRPFQGPRCYKAFPERCSAVFVPNKSRPAQLFHCVSCITELCDRVVVRLWSSDRGHSWVEGVLKPHVVSALPNLHFKHCPRDIYLHCPQHNIWHTLCLVHSAAIWETAVRSLLLSRSHPRANQVRSTRLEHCIRLQRVRFAHLSSPAAGLVTVFLQNVSACYACMPYCCNLICFCLAVCH